MAMAKGRIKVSDGKGFRDEIKSGYAWPRPKWAKGNNYHAPMINVAFDLDKDGITRTNYYVGRDAGDVLVEKVLGVPVWSEVTGGTKNGYRLNPAWYSYDEIMNACQLIRKDSFDDTLAENVVKYLNDWAQLYSTMDIEFMQDILIPMRQALTVNEFKALPDNIVKAIVVECVKDFSVTNCGLLILHTRTIACNFPGIGFRKGSVPNEEEDSNRMYDMCCAIAKFATIIQQHNFYLAPDSDGIRDNPDTQTYKDAYKKWLFKFGENNQIWGEPYEESVALHLWVQCDLECKYDIADNQGKISFQQCAQSLSGNKLDKANSGRRDGRAAYNPSYSNIIFNYTSGETDSLAGQNLKIADFRGKDGNYKEIPAEILHKFEADIFADVQGKKLNSLAPFKYEAACQDFRSHVSSLDLSFMTPKDKKELAYAASLIGFTFPDSESFEDVDTSKTNQQATATTNQTSMPNPNSVPVQNNANNAPTPNSMPVDSTNSIPTPNSMPTANASSMPTPNSTPVSNGMGNATMGGVAQ